jgi:hypothetical protein
VLLQVQVQVESRLAVGQGLRCLGSGSAVQCSTRWQQQQAGWQQEWGSALAVLLQQLLLVSAARRVKARRHCYVLAAAPAGLAAALPVLAWPLAAAGQVRLLHHLLQTAPQLALQPSATAAV